MKLHSESITDGARIPDDFTFCKPAEEGRMCMSKNLNPHLAWEGVPDGTRSFALICHDPDVPSKADDVNQEGKVVPATLPRVDFFHWVLIDLPAEMREIAAGSFSSEVTPGGKSGPEAPEGRQGVNDFTAFLAGDEEMKGDYYGYDGPCPPWNDEILHHYVFTIYALDVPRCPVAGRFGGQEVREAIAGHVLAEASITGTYTLNPDVSG